MDHADEGKLRTCYTQGTKDWTDSMSEYEQKLTDSPPDAVRASRNSPFSIAVLLASVVALATFLGTKAWFAGGRHW